MVLKIIKSVFYSNEQIKDITNSLKSKIKFYFRKRLRKNENKNHY